MLNRFFQSALLLLLRGIALLLLLLLRGITLLLLLRGIALRTDRHFAWAIHLCHTGLLSG